MNSLQKHDKGGLPLKKGALFISGLIFVLLFTVASIAAPPPSVGGSRPALGTVGSLPTLVSDLSIAGISIDKPIKEGDQVGNSQVTITIKNGGPGGVNSFKVKITCQAIRGTVPPSLLLLEKTVNQPLAVNGQCNVIWPAPSSAKWTVGDYRILVEVKSESDKNLQNNAQYFAFKVPPAVPTAIKVTSPNGGEVLYKGRTYNITWTYTGNPNVPVVIVMVASNDITKLYQIGKNVPLGQNGTGSFSWTIPWEIERRTDYKMFVGNGSYTVDFLDSSDNNFTISEFVK